MKQTFIVFLLLASITSFAQLDLKESKIIGISGGGGGFGGLQGFRGIVQTSYGKFKTDRLYIGTNISFERFDQSRIARRIERLYGPSNGVTIGSGSTEPNSSFSHIEINIAAGLNLKYFFGNKSFRPYVATELGLRYSRFNSSESIIARYEPNQFAPYAGVGTGFMAFLGKSNRLSLDFDLRYLIFTPPKLSNGYVQGVNHRFRPTIGFSYRF